MRDMTKGKIPLFEKQRFDPKNGSRLGRFLKWQNRAGMRQNQAHIY